jgi:hypothetical protein
MLSLILREGKSIDAALATGAGGEQVSVRQQQPIDRHLYAQRHVIERCFPKLEQFLVRTYGISAIVPGRGT